jgi:hypothetical protein
MENFFHPSNYEKKQKRRRKKIGKRDEMKPGDEIASFNQNLSDHEEHEKKFTSSQKKSFCVSSINSHTTFFSSPKQFSKKLTLFSSLINSNLFHLDHMKHYIYTQSSHCCLFHSYLFSMNS